MQGSADPNFLAWSDPADLGNAGLHIISTKVRTLESEAGPALADPGNGEDLDPISARSV